MYKSIDSYSVPNKGQSKMNGYSEVLNIKKGEMFEFIDVCNKHWWKMRCVKSGKVGLVPINYLEVSNETTLEEKSSVLESIDRAVDTIYKGAGKNGELNHNQRKQLQKLIEHRRKVYSEYLKEKSTPDEKKASKMGQGYSLDSDIPQQPNRPAPAPPQGGKRFSFKRQAPEPPSGQIPHNIGEELVEQIRISTGLPYSKSIAAVETMLMHIRHRVPTISNEADFILEDLYHSKENAGNLTDEVLLATHDGQVLQGLVEELVKHKDDSQQRSWAVHEDEAIITKLLEDVLSILEGANPYVCLAVVRQDCYDGLNALVQYYQMETRTQLRIHLLKVFCACCSLGKEVISQLLCTILPVELSRDMQATRHMSAVEEAYQKFLHSAKLSMIIFSSGEAIPYQHYEYLDKTFIHFIFDTIESPPEEEDEELINLLVTLILSYNQHFNDVNKNLVMQALSERQTSTTFTEKLMLLVNRGDDPVNIFGFLTTFPNSLLKFFADIFSSKQTSGIFFTSDLMVLIEIVLRMVQDLCPGNKQRTEYLSLMHGIMSTTDYTEHQHQNVEMKRCLQRIMDEEGPDVKQDQLIVQEIYKSFPNVFRS